MSDRDGSRGPDRPGALQELIQLSRVLMQSRDPGVLLDRIVDSSMALVGAERGFLFSREQEGEALKQQIGKTAAGDLVDAESAQVSRSIVNQVDASGKGVAVGDTENNELLSARTSIVAFRVRSVLCTPLAHAGKKFGALYLDSRIITLAFKRSDLDLLESFAALAGAALANAASYQALEALNLTLEERVKERTEQLARSEERYALAARGANDGLWDWDLGSNLIYFSPRWKSMLGLDGVEVEGRPEAWFDRVHPADIATLRACLQLHFDGATEHFEHEHRMLHQDRTYRWMLCRGLAIRANDRAVRFAGSQTDVTERKVRDPLTGLPNLVLFMDRLELAIARSKRRQSLFAVLSLHLDRFDIVSESMGLAASERMLVEGAKRIAVCLRFADTVAHSRGGNFLILVEDIRSEKDATDVVARIQEAFFPAFHVLDQDIFTTATIGVALSSTDYADPEKAIRDADTARARARDAGGGHHELFDQDTQARVLKSIRLEAELRAAVHQGQFRTFYQPIVSTKTRAIIGFEALIRWFHPERGIIPPLDFIPLAEETGLIVPIGAWILQDACAQARVWQAKYPAHEGLVIAVNVSIRQLSKATMMADIHDTLQATGLPARCLKLEITESVLVDAADAVVQKLGELKALEVRLSIDDFGTGYSSLSYLQKFPVDTLKVDRCFVKNLGVDAQSEAIARAIVMLAHNLKLDVVAEGVETEAQLDRVRLLECEYAQGFLFSKPVTATDAEAFLHEGSHFSA